ncbi:hypothetical protein BD413DRAFT_676368 [Trametes elegans]|nr:hypothetical protein BD413DRAFT_676368 [Trametes elegans]
MMDAQEVPNASERLGGPTYKVRRNGAVTIRVMNAFDAQHHEVFHSSRESFTSACLGLIRPVQPMQPKLFALFALAAAVVKAAPEKRDDSTSIGFTTITLPNGTPFAIPTNSRIPVSVAASWVDANSALFASAFGTPSLLGYEASVAYIEAQGAVGTATQLTVVEATINSTPVVEVSSIGGKQAITIATGTAGATTIFGGEVFTAAPNAGQQVASVPRGLWAGAAAVIGCIGLGLLLFCEEVI